MSNVTQVMSKLTKVMSNTTDVMFNDNIVMSSHSLKYHKNDVNSWGCKRLFQESIHSQLNVKSKFKTELLISIHIFYFILFGGKC